MTKKSDKSNKDLKTRLKELESLVLKRDKMEEELRASEEKLKILFDKAPDAYFLNDRDGKFVDCNKAAEKLTGYKKEEMVGKNFVDLNLLPPHQVQIALSKFVRTVGGKAALADKYTLKRKDGTEAEVEINAHSVKIGGKTFTLGMARDFTERGRMEKALKESEEKWRCLAQTAPAVIITVGEDGVIQFLNRTVGKYTPESAIGTSIYDYVPSDQREVLRSSMLKVFRTGKPASYEILGDGVRGPSTAWYESHLGPIVFEGKVIAVTLVAIDITERKEQEEELRIKDASMASAINPIAISDIEGKLKYINDSFCKMWGLEDASQALGKSALEFWQEKDKASEVIEILGRKGCWKGRLAAKKKDGSIFDVHICASLIKSKEGEPMGITASFMDEQIWEISTVAPMAKFE